MTIIDRVYILQNTSIHMNRNPLYNIIMATTLMACTVGCMRNSAIMNNKTELNDNQKELINDGWYIPSIIPTGELSAEYGIKSVFGQQDNYFDIEVGVGYDVAIKIMDMATDKCIRYVLVPENSSVNIPMIPQGKYYLKLAYGKDWMEYDNGDGMLNAKFTKNVSYDRSMDAFDFGKKNSADIVSYTLNINVIGSELQNNFNTIEISESEFLK